MRSTVAPKGSDEGSTPEWSIKVISVAGISRHNWIRPPMDLVQIAISSRLAHGDLVAADRALEAGPADHGTRLVLIKQLLVSCTNVSDLDAISRSLYKKNPELNEIIAPHRRNFDFAKYLRNIAVGHVNPALCRKAIEWRPELNAVLADLKEDSDVFVGYAVLETAINTYVDKNQHGLFEGETDLAYLPDMTRFLNYLGQTVHVGIAYCHALAAVAVGQANLLDFQANMLELAKTAGQTDFRFITRNGEKS